MDNLHRLLAHALNCMLQKAVLRPDSVLVVCCGLLAKWLRVRAGARECCTFLFFLWFVSLSSLARYTVSASACDRLLMDI